MVPLTLKWVPKDLYVGLTLKKYILLDPLGPIISLREYKHLSINHAPKLVWWNGTVQ